MTNSHLGYFLNPALFSMCRIVSWIKYENQFTNSCLAYSGSWVSKNQIICLQLSRPLFLAVLSTYFHGTTSILLQWLVMYRIFSDLLHRSLTFPWHSRLFPTISVCSMTISIRFPSLSVVFPIVPSSVLSVFSVYFRLSLCFDSFPFSFLY